MLTLLGLTYMFAFSALIYKNLYTQRKKILEIENKQW